jgi:hypothetical protein
MQGGTVGWAGGAWKFVAIASVLVAGCGGTDGRVPVNGTVTLDGKPAAGLLVRFYASLETKGNGGYGYTDASGRFTATTLQARPGLYPGDYAVTLEYSDDSPEPQPVSTPSKILGVYANPVSTPLKVTIDAPRAELDLRATSGAR